MDVLDAEPRRLRDSVMIKMLLIGVLVLGLLIPLAMVGSLVEERQQRQAGVEKEMASTWGEAQTVGGPMLAIPYVMTGADGKRETSVAWFLPETLRIDGEVQPQVRSRGIYDLVVYQAGLRVSGAFRCPDFQPWGIRPADILWDQAGIFIGIHDMKGLRRAVRLSWAGRTFELSPGGALLGVWDGSLRTPIPSPAALQGQALPFRFDLALDGSGQVRFVPFGKQTVVSLRSSWKDPSFSGPWLPESRRTGPQGFTATWSVSSYGRSYPQQWLARDQEQLIPATPVLGSAFGVDLIRPVDIYQKTERSVKYGVLFLLFTFLAFFLFEVFSPAALHPMNYLLVGSALCLFFLLLLSFSEHLPFGVAYGIAAAGIVVLITGYSWSVLQGGARALAMGALLCLLYGYLYLVLQAEDFALLLGSIALFVALAGVMYLTRGVDWYAPRGSRLRSDRPSS
jgi:inner membrane protein